MCKHNSFRRKKGEFVFPTTAHITFIPEHAAAMGRIEEAWGSTGSAQRVHQEPRFPKERENALCHTLGGEEAAEHKNASKEERPLQLASF